MYTKVELNTIHDPLQRTLDQQRIHTIIHVMLYMSAEDQSNAEVKQGLKKYKNQDCGSTKNPYNKCAQHRIV